MQAETEVTFDKNQVDEILSKTIASELQNKDFIPDQVEEWLSRIFQELLTKLTEQGHNYKYCINGTITQNCGAGLHFANSCYFEKASDNYTFCKYQTGNMLCIVVVYAFRI